MRTMIPDDNIKEAFKIFDRDNNGFISLKELQHVMYCLGKYEKALVFTISSDKSESNNS